MNRILFLIVFFVGTIVALAEDRVELQYRPGPVANPLKGLVPYASNSNEFFPHSMEFNYVAYSALVKGYDHFEWTELEALLDQISGRGHQAVLRIYLEYPGKTTGIPKFLIDDGLRVHRYLNTNTQPFPPSPVETPDYENSSLRKSLKNFITAFGKKYDGDARIGFITAGLLGTWGEWHTYPRDDLFASKAVQAEVMDAYEAAFKRTPILLRYPAGENTWGKAANAHRSLGYHDDSFAWCTLETGKKEDDWFYIPALKQAGSAAIDKWKSQPIGGEIRPEAWGKVFDVNPGDKNIQDFRKCVDQTHVSWLMDSGMFEKVPDKRRKQRAEVEVGRMGYDFHVRSVTVASEEDRVRIQLILENRGVAPFYYNWKAQYGLIAEAKVVKTFASNGQITKLLPGESPRVWDDTIDLADVKAGEYTLCLRIPNTLPNGMPLRFANTTQDHDLDGWLSLITIRR